MLISGVAMFMAACGGGNGAGNAVDVSLFEWGVDPSPTSVTAGQVTFTANNEGGEAHELVIVKDVAPADLPVDEDGRVVEDQLPAGAFIGEIEEFAAGGTETATFDLTAGTYTIFCNILEEEGGQTESHFQNGMVNTIEVSG
jgi:plastocyanin